MAATSDFTPLTITGDGFYDAYLSLEPAKRMRFPRYDSHERFSEAVTIKGADLQGGHSDGRNMFELNSYAPEGVVESDGDRCLLASLEFQSVIISSQSGGRLHLSGILTGADTYGQDVHDLIAAGSALAEIPELMGDYDDIRYMPPRYAPLQDYFGWEATIRLVPRSAA